MSDVPELSGEDAKLVTLARATRARTGAAEGAAVRDEMGRTYAAGTVDLPSLQLSAVQSCVAMAHAAGARGLEAVVVMGQDATPHASDVAVVRDFGGDDVPVWMVDLRGTVLS